MLRRAVLGTRRLAGARAVTISATSAASEPVHDQLLDASPPAAAISPDARFQVVGSPFSLLSVSLAASQSLYTRRGTLVGLSGSPEHTRSTLSVLEPLRRLPVGIPFLYQRVTSTSPVTALVSTRAATPSIVTVHLDGRQDWLIAQRQALLAWTGQTLSLKPQYNIQLGLANWGNTSVTGRGLLALVGSGQLYQVQLRPGETYVAHPSHVVAYTSSAFPPLPFRFRSSQLRLQVADLGFGSLAQRVKFFRVMGETATLRAFANAYYTLKTWLRRSIWGDRLFLRFQGPTTLLIQSRPARLSDVLTLRDVHEIAESPPGAVQDAVTKKIKQEIDEVHATPSGARPAVTEDNGTKVTYATVRHGKTEFDKQP